jgi:hypothetical protein
LVFVAFAGISGGGAGRKRTLPGGVGVWVWRSLIFHVFVVFYVALFQKYRYLAGGLWD